MAMIYTYDGTNASTNLNPNNAAEMIWYIKQTLVQAGWIVISSGDGTTGTVSGTNYSRTGDLFTTLSSVRSGSGGFNNFNAWFVIKQPASTRNSQRQILFKYVGANSWLISYSYSVGFSAASVTAGNVLPTASDSVNILSSLAIFSISSANTYRLNISADNAAPYGFWASWFPFGTAGTTCSGMIVMDPLLDGTYAANDADPYIFYIPNANSPSTLSTAVANSSGVGAIPVEGTYGVLSYYKDTGGTFTAALVNTPGMSLTGIPAGLGANPYSGKDEIFPILYGRRSGLSTQTGFKGMGTLMKWCGIQRNTGDTLSVVSLGSKDRIVMGQISLPWNGSAVLQ